MQLDSKVVYLLLGNNLGDRLAVLHAAIVKIEQQIGTVFIQSSFYETAAWGKEDQPSFLNIALGVKTSLSALQVLDKALSIEEELGRVRHEKWGARIIDIDLLLYDQEIVAQGDKLTLPHPEMHNRKFVLQPMAEIAPNVVHPIFKKTIFDLFKELNDDLTVSKI